MRQLGALALSEQGSCKMSCDCVGWVVPLFINQLYCTSSTIYVSLFANYDFEIAQGEHRVFPCKRQTTRLLILYSVVRHCI